MILSLYSPVTLDAANSPCRILALTLEARGEGEGRIYFLNGLQGSGEALRNVVTVGGFDVAPELVAAQVSVRGPALDPDIDAPASVDFGTLAVGSEATRTVTVKNAGEGTLRIGSLALEDGSSAGFHVESPALPADVSPGAGLDVTVRYSPAAEGSDMATLVIASDDPDEAETKVVLTGQGSEERFASIRGPEALDFGSVPVGQELRLMVELTSAGTADLEIRAMALASGSPAAFRITSVPAGTTFAPGATIDVELSFTPVSEGAASGTLVVSSSARDVPELLISLEGAGVSSGPGTVEVDPAVLDFGRIQLSAARTLTVTVTNRAAEAVDLSVIEFTDSPGGAFTFARRPPIGRIPPGAGVAIAVTFAPKQPGPRRGALRIQSAAVETLVVQLIGSAASDDIFRRGDANPDGRIDMSDPINILRFLFLGGVRPSCLDAADADDSGRIEITDAVFLLGALFLGNRVIPEPSPGCGLDPKVDGLGCAVGCQMQ